MSNDNTELQEFLKYVEEPWSFNACMGYAIMAMQDAGLDSSIIELVTKQIQYNLDNYTLDEAAKIYCESPY